MGRLNRSDRDAGFFLLDVLVALFIVLVGFSAFLTGISLAESLAIRQEARVQSMIVQRNADAADRALVFQKE